jgi:hypothetical protein
MTTAISVPEGFWQKGELFFALGTERSSRLYMGTLVRKGWKWHVEIGQIKLE